MIPRIPTSSREKRPREGPAPPEIDIGGGIYSASVGDSEAIKAKKT